MHNNDLYYLFNGILRSSLRHFHLLLYLNYITKLNSTESCFLCGPVDDDVGEQDNDHADYRRIKAMRRLGPKHGILKGFERRHNGILKGFEGCDDNSFNSVSHFLHQYFESVPKVSTEPWTEPFAPPIINHQINE